MKYVKWIYLLEAGFCFLFFYYSNGLAFPTEEDNSYKYVKELFSSGSDDDVAIAVIGFICILTSLTLMISKSIIYVDIVVSISFILQLLSLTLIQMGSIYYTLYVDWNGYLHGTMFSQVTILFIVIRENVKYSSQQKL
jgi:hypothetical protein